jgi:hypothetical protein
MADANEMERRHRAITNVLRQISAEAAQFPPVVRAEDILKEVTRDNWQVGKNPWVTRGNDHE